MKRFVFILFIVVALVSTVLAREVYVWMDPSTEPEFKKWLRERYYPTFEQQTGIKVKIAEVPYDEQTLRMRLMSGDGPDNVGLAGPSFAPFYIDAGYLIPLDEYAKKYHWDELLTDLYWKLGHYKGKLWTIPQEFEAMVLFYNPKVFKENGWEPPRTIKEMEELAAKMKEKGIMPFANGNVGWKPAVEWIFTAAINHIAGPEKVYEALTGKIPWTDPAFVESVEATKRWYQEGWLGGGKFFSLDVGEVYQLLVEGKAGMAIWGTWAFGDLTYYSTSTEDWDWVPFPSKEGLSYPIFAIGVGSCIGINKNAKDPDAVAQLINFDLREPLDNLELFAEDLKLFGTVAYTPIKSFEVNEETAKKLEKLGVDKRIVKFLELSTKAFEKNTYGYVTWTFWPPESDRYIIDNLELVWLGEMSSEKFLKGLQEVFEREVKEGKAIYIPPRS
ncbi:MAG: extracellular solute-binding protein [Staphylothermus sp.]|nr:extracellular solute-binding protein [Staphylothermus sp.]